MKTSEERLPEIEDREEIKRAASRGCRGDNVPREFYLLR